MGVRCLWGGMLRGSEDTEPALAARTGDVLGMCQQSRGLSFAPGAAPSIQK